MTHRPLIQVNKGSSLQFGISSMGLYHHLVCTFSSPGLNIDSTDLHSEGEMAFFWRANGQSRRSPARILFMLVSLCVC